MFPFSSAGALNRNQRINEHRLALLFGLAGVLHAVIDPILTYYLTVSGSLGSESNPFLRWGLSQGMPVFLAIHLPLLLFLFLAFYGLLYFIRRANPPSDENLARATEIGFGVLIVWGHGLVAWNLGVLFGFV